MKKIIALIFALILAASISFAEEEKESPKLGPLAQCIVKLIDINTATMDQLLALPGVDYAYCKKIIGGRPYTKLNQLVSKNIIPADTYEKIKDNIVINQPKK
jgi:DNA uptake protein ComE-like DNA-binding protein